MTAPISNEPTTHGYTTMRDATKSSVKKYQAMQNVAGETTTMDAFRDGKDLYCETASQMFAVPVEKHGVNSDLRQKGKIATLSCGYQGSAGTLKTMGALTMGLAEHELKPIVDA